MASSDTPLTAAERHCTKSNISFDLQSKPSNPKYSGDTGSPARELSVRYEKQPRHPITQDAPEDLVEYPKGFALEEVNDADYCDHRNPQITDEFRGLDKVSWYGSASFMTDGGFQSSWGKAYRYFSLKSTFLIAVLVLEIGSLICALAKNSTSLIVWRAVTGLGAAGLATGSYTTLSPSLSSLKKDLHIPVSWGCAMALPLHAKPVKAGWGEILEQMDFVGVGMIMSAIVTCILALQYGGQPDAWNSGKVIGLLVGFVAIWVAFISWEKFQGERAMVVPRLFKPRNSVYNVTPTMTGVYNLPLILMFTITMICSGILVTAAGHAVPLKVCAAAIATIACGLLYTLDVDTSMAKWISYQILGAFGWGIGTQLPINVSQNNAEPSGISTITAMVLFFQCSGGTSFVTAAQAAFVNKLITALPTTAPGVDSAVVIATGATEIRTAFPQDQVPGIAEAYMAGIKAALAIPMAASGIALVVSLFSKRKRPNEGAAKTSGVA